MRMVWRGTISFGLVTIPVRLYAATENKNVPAHQVHINDGGRVQYKRVCSIDGAEVPYEEIGRGYESATGELVMLDEDDLAMLTSKSSRSIEVISFLPVQVVDPIYLDRSYYVEPEPQGAKAYRLLRDAMRKLDRVAVAKVTLRNREIVAVLREHSDVLVLATMLWLDEVRAPEFPFLAEADEWPTQAQGQAMAEALIESLSDEELDPDRYRDVHRETLTALIDAKATGRAMSQNGEPTATPPDLLSALRASIEAAKQRRAAAADDGGDRAAASAGPAKKKLKKPAQSERETDSPKKRR
jgi:DNA end-binding protein Ku